MRGRPFQPGNKYGRGRPPGSRNKIASVVQKTLEEHAESLTKKCVYMALQGNNPTAMRICMERLMPAQRQRVVQFKLPALKTMGDMAAASETVLKGVARGKLTPGEGQAFSEMLEDRRRGMESEELEGRVRALEKGNNKRQS